jgi:hypothetical protein
MLRVTCAQRWPDGYQAGVPEVIHAEMCGFFVAIGTAWFVEIVGRRCDTKLYDLVSGE